MTNNHRLNLFVLSIWVVHSFNVKMKLLIVYILYLPYNHLLDIYQDMKKTAVSQNKNKSRSVNRTASVGLIQYLNQKYQKSIPLSALTAAHKLYGKSRPLAKDDKFVNRFSDNRGNIDTGRLVDYLGRSEPQERGKGLSDEAVKRVYDNFSNHDGNLTFEYIMKMGQSCGVTINERTAKAIVRKYGKRKDHLSIQDCLKINNKKREQSTSQPKRVK